MSILKRAIGSISARFAPGQSRKRLSRSAAATAAVLCGWLLLNLLAYGSLLLPATEEESLLAERNNTPRAQRATYLPSTPFFGVAAAESSQKQLEVDLANIPITQLNLLLSGVFDNTSKDRASALVAEKGKPAQRVYIGDTLPGGAELYSVAVDHIVLRRNDKMEKLTYPDEDGRPTVPMQRYVNTVRQATRAVEASAAGSAEKRQSIRERLEKLRELARQRRGQREN